MSDHSLIEKLDKIIAYSDPEEAVTKSERMTKMRWIWELARSAKYLIKHQAEQPEESVKTVTVQSGGTHWTPNPWEEPSEYSVERQYCITCGQLFEVTSDTGFQCSNCSCGASASSANQREYSVPAEVYEYIRAMAGNEQIAGGVVTKAKELLGKLQQREMRYHIGRAPSCFGNVYLGDKLIAKANGISDGLETLIELANRVTEPVSIDAAISAIDNVTLNGDPERRVKEMRADQAKACAKTWGLSYVD